MRRCGRIVIHSTGIRLFLEMKKNYFGAFVINHQIGRACASMYEWTRTQTHTTLGQQQAADVHARSHRRRRHMTHPFDECRCRNHSSLNIYLFIKIVILSGLVCHMHNSWTHCIHMKSKYMKINTVIEPTSNGDTLECISFGVVSTEWSLCRTSKNCLRHSFAVSICIDVFY